MRAFIATLAVFAGPLYAADLILPDKPPAMQPAENQQFQKHQRNPNAVKVDRVLVNPKALQGTSITLKVDGKTYTYTGKPNGIYWTGRTKEFDLLQLCNCEGGLSGMAQAGTKQYQILSIGPTQASLSELKYGAKK